MEWAPSSAAPSLASLREQALRLPSSAHNSDLPPLNLGFDQIESQSRRIAAKRAGENGGPNGSAYYLLASGGIDAQVYSAAVNELDVTSTFEPLLPLADTDVEGHLQAEHQQTILSTMSEGRQATAASFYKNLDIQMRHSWEQQKQSLFEELGRHQSGASTSAHTLDTPRRSGAGGFDRDSPIGAVPSVSSQLQMQSRKLRYDIVIRRLNEARKAKSAFDLVKELGEASGGAGNDLKSRQMDEAWRLLARLTRSSTTEGPARQRQYAQQYLVADPDSDDAGRLRASICEGAKEHLQEEFMTHVENTIKAQPLEAHLGGDPSFENKIRAYIDVKYKKHGAWATTRLEMINSTPVWARMYYLLRIGQPKKALQFAQENERQIQKLENTFVTYFKKWIDSPDHRLDRLTRNQFLIEYNRRIKGNSEADPYKHAIYKLIGRVDIERRNVPEVTKTTEDWLWFQLSLTRETPGDGEAARDQYGMRDLGRVLIELGDNRLKPVLQFRVLLLGGQFERAIDFLFRQSQLQTDAVHFAIALSYFGLLRVPSQPSAVNLLIEEGPSKVPCLNFSRLLHRYTREFVQVDPQEALQYLYLICLNSDLPAPLGKKQTQECLEYIRDVVLETRKYRELLGDVLSDGTKVPGMIQRDLSLIDLDNESTFTRDLISAAARTARQEKRFEDAILLFDLAEQKNAVFEVLNIELGNSLSRPSTTSNVGGGDRQYFQEGTANVSISTGPADIVRTARRLYDLYRVDEVDPRSRKTCQILLNLKEVMILYEQQHLDQALKMIEALDIIPLNSVLVDIIKAAEDFKELDEAIIRNFDGILLTTMDIIYKLHSALRESPFGDASRQERMVDLRSKARSLMMFAGMLRFRLTSETYAKLTRLDVHVA
ncbi:nuclear pore complex protein Nup93, partial [Phenoliferia sp. Uapishka_3]